MDKQKQIEEKRKHFVEVNEMAKEIDKYYPNAKITNSHLAEYLYNAGYRKIPENAVVLEKPIYDYIMQDNRTIQELARKETAEKFAERLKEVIKEKYEIYGADEMDDDEIDEICKEITEEK
jgi:hypothetical protein